MAAKKYSFVYVLIRLTSLALKQHFFCILYMHTRLVRLISTLKNINFLAAIYAFGISRVRMPRNISVIFGIQAGCKKVYSRIDEEPFSSPLVYRWV